MLSLEPMDEYFKVDNSAIKHDGFFVNRGKLERIVTTKTAAAAAAKITLTLGDAAALQAEVKAVNKQNAGVLLSKDPSNRFAFIPQNKRKNIVRHGLCFKAVNWFFCKPATQSAAAAMICLKIPLPPQNGVLAFPNTHVEFGADGNNDSRELNEGELISDDHDAAVKSSEIISDEGLPLYLPLVIRA
ncbi:unnamed protein product [Prunus armeniaca]|uniref:Uncharacterized protein n=1 Tax=Prunus armeniaca TaxID=36596 RepID=A0A6J5UYJ6_PRUAR|nr:unnamed protein product [Prunus armeniaca]